MNDCKNCGMNYDQSEYDFCPYCGQEAEEKIADSAEETPRKKIIKKEKPVSPEKSKPAGNRLIYILIGLAALVIIAAAVSAVFIFSDSGVTVPDKYATIQEAIDAAEEGDEIVVQVGVYRENIDFKGKNIILRSTDPDDPAVVSETIIDGGGSGIVVSFRSGEGEGAVLSGFTVTRGSGIVISGSGSPVIEKCIIEDNTAEYGAGIYIVNSTPTIIENTIMGNSGSLGGGIFIEEASPWIEGNTITGNRSNMGSGIAIIYDSKPTVKDNVITDNYAANIGGGVLIAVGSNPLIEGNMITGNYAERNGGGLYIDESEPLIQENTISRNQAANGGGIFIVNSMGAPFLISANNIEDNISFIAGGGIYMQGSTPTIEGNNFTKNESEHLGGAMAVYISSPVLRLNIFESNQAKDVGRGGAIWFSTDSTLELNDPDDNTYLLNLPDDLHQE
jgi:parallel beta-helix repeat protein